MGDQAYFRSAIAHFRGFHGAGCSCETLEDKRLRALDPVGSSLREWAITTECPPMDDIVGMWRFFHTSKTGTEPVFLQIQATTRNFSSMLVEVALQMSKSSFEC